MPKQRRPKLRASIQLLYSYTKLVLALQLAYCSAEVSQTSALVSLQNTQPCLLLIKVACSQLSIFVMVKRRYNYSLQYWSKCLKLSWLGSWLRSWLYSQFILPNHCSNESECHLLLLFHCCLNFLVPMSPVNISPERASAQLFHLAQLL